MDIVCMDAGGLLAYVSPFSLFVQDGLTALHIACRRGLSGMVGAILTAGRSQHWLLMPYNNEEELVSEGHPADRIIINFKERLMVKLHMHYF